ncbi:hypothetical protein FC97_GL001418 [Companilactobacillus kimchii DSM 13961 = JCM 10707]|uniref:BspA family leucine-rich repeat surface protein n=1 Tax=Companilactobacillus kimchii DSM 13961 = JCM 10707 TaxID=1423765 RepID=A0ABR5NR86_9LACO|nr:hypothetical protein FC97_GL001418 [Companilactobacillus kimchii DSM 13961 = JCM 10707]
MGRILIVAAVSTAIMSAATTLNNVSTVHADTVSDSSVVNTNNQVQTNSNIKTGTWGTATWSWDQNASEITVSGGQAGEASDAPWNRNRPNFGLQKINFTGKLILPANCQNLFSALTGLTSMNGMSNLDTSNVTNMSDMFFNMPSITNLDVSHFDTSKVNRMDDMFTDDRLLRYVDVSHFDTSNVTNMGGMFFDTFVLKNLDVSHFNTSKVTDMSDMFYAMFRLTDLDVSHFDTSKVTDMSDMFGRLNDLNELDVSHFNTSKVTDMSHMFMWNFSLTNLDLSSFDMSNVSKTEGMFEDDSRLNTLVLGSKNKFRSNTGLPAVKESGDYLGKWRNVKDINGDNINNGSTYTSDDLLTNYTPDRAGTYVWAKKSKDVSDIKDLYNDVKLAISYSAGMFNSEPGNSLKYKDEFNGRSIYGALDYAYNSNNYNELIKVMHDSLAKAHESIGSLQVNNAKAQELGLNVDQLKEDLSKDSVPYEYSNDNDIDGINKQLDSFVSVRAKYNKLVQQGVFDKSNYWTINK